MSDLLPADVQDWDWRQRPAEVIRLHGEPYSLEWERDLRQLRTRVTFLDYPVATRWFDDVDLRTDPLAIPAWLLECVEHWEVNGFPWKKEDPDEPR
jgi:hypothetical protein